MSCVIKITIAPEASFIPDDVENLLKRWFPKAKIVDEEYEVTIEVNRETIALIRFEDMEWDLMCSIMPGQLLRTIYIMDLLSMGPEVENSLTQEDCETIGEELQSKDEAIEESLELFSQADHGPKWFKKDSWDKAIKMLYQE